MGMSIAVSQVAEHGMQVLVSPRGRRAGVKIPVCFRCPLAGLAAVG